MKIQAKVTGVEACLRKLENIKQSVRNKAERKMVTKASVPVVKAGKAHAPVREKSGGIKVVGTTRKSWGKKIKKGKHGYMAVIGPRRGFKRQIGTRLRGGRKSKAGDPIMHDPAKVAHLVKQNVQAAERALSQTINQAQSIMAQVAWEEVQKAAK